MAFLTDSEKQKISEAIRRAETKTSGEIVTVIAYESDDYYYIPTLWAALMALLLPALVTLSGLQGSVLDNYGAQVAVFAICAALFRIPALKHRLIPKVVKQQRAQRLAREQFLLQNLHHTAGRTGVLFFVSVAEHYVEIIADKGINDVVPSGTWDNVVANFVAQVKEKKVADGFVQAIDACGELLIQHFPVAENDRNELPNRLIEL